MEDFKKKKKKEKEKKNKRLIAVGYTYQGYSHS